MTDFRTLIRKQLDEELIYGCVVMAGDSRKDLIFCLRHTASPTGSQRKK